MHFRRHTLALLVFSLACIVFLIGRASAAGNSHGAGGTPNPMEHVIDQGIIEIGGYKIFSKYMMLEVIGAGIILAVYIPVAKRAKTGEAPKGWFANLFESLLTFIRDDIAKPNLGEHDADKYVPFLWTMFLFILVCNLLGLVPYGGSPTANIYMTGGLALCVFFAIHGSAVAKMGAGHYLMSLWPHLDIPIPVVGWVINGFVCVIEIFGNLIKNGVLAIRLFANMLGGHSALAMIMLFILIAADPRAMGLWITVTLGSVAGALFLNLLEILVAALQAYIFVFLTALFMGMAAHPSH
jgi:F-type H+-transporting ATPase subunit a